MKLGKGSYFGEECLFELESKYTYMYFLFFLKKFLIEVERKKQFAYMLISTQ